MCRGTGCICTNFTMTMSAAIDKHFDTFKITVLVLQTSHGGFLGVESEISFKN